MTPLCFKHIITASKSSCYTRTTNMSISGAINDLIHAILSIVTGLFRAIFAFLNGIVSLVWGTITGTAHVAKEGLDLIFCKPSCSCVQFSRALQLTLSPDYTANIGVLLVIGAAILAYQIFVGYQAGDGTPKELMSYMRKVVEKGRAPRVTNNRVGAGRKKVA